jgi:hypothetical protein
VTLPFGPAEEVTAWTTGTALKEAVTVQSAVTALVVYVVPVKVPPQVPPTLAV